MSGVARTDSYMKITFFRFYAVSIHLVAAHAKGGKNEPEQKQGATDAWGQLMVHNY